MIFTSDKCQPGDDLACTVCGIRLRHDRYVRTCKKGTQPERIAGALAKRRPRTAEEVAEINAICEPCKYFKHGMCMILIRAGCGSCKTAEDFAAKIKAGRGCPDKPARFSATEFVEIPE